MTYLSNSKKIYGIIMRIVSLLFVCSFAISFASIPYIEDELPAKGKSTEQLSWRSYKIPTLVILASENNQVEYYEKALSSSRSFGQTPQKESYRYLFQTANYYAFLFTFEGSGNARIAYAKKTDAKLETVSKSILVRKQGTYLTGFNNSDSKIWYGTFYYVKALKGKNGSVIISKEKSGNNAEITEEFTDGVVILPMPDQYIIVKNAELLPAEVAPLSKINNFIKNQKPTNEDEEIIEY